MENVASKNGMSFSGIQFGGAFESVKPLNIEI